MRKHNGQILQIEIEILKNIKNIQKKDNNNRNQDLRLNEIVHVIFIIKNI